MIKDEALMVELIKEANIYGFEVKDYNQLDAIKRKIRTFIPILLKYLDLFEARNYKNAIVGLLGVKGFNEVTEILLSKYNDKNYNINKWNVGDALYSIQDKRFEDKYIEIVENDANGTSRQMIVILLGRLRCEKAIQTLIDLLQDDDVNGHAIMALGYFKNNELIKYVEPFLHHEKRWIRKEAEKAIKKIQSQQVNL